MTAINPTCLVTGNLAEAPYIAPDGTRISFTILHTDRVFDQTTQQWVDRQTTSVEVTFFNRRAERLVQTVRANPARYAKGTPVVAWGQISDKPRAWIGKSGEADCRLQLLGDGIAADQYKAEDRLQRRSQATAPSPAAPATSMGADPWNDGFAQPRFSNDDPFGGIPSQQ